MYRNEKGFELAKTIVNRSKYNFKKIEFKVKTSRYEEDLILKSNANIVVFDVLQVNKKLLSNLNKSNKYLIGFDDIGSGACYYNSHFISLVTPKINNNHTYVGYKYLNLSEDIKRKKYIKKILKYYNINWRK